MEQNETNEKGANESQKNGNKPEMKFKAGAVSATIWQNSGERKTGEQTHFRTVSLSRNYKDKSGAWKSTGTFRIHDLPRAALVLNKAYEYLNFAEQNSSAETGGYF